MTNLVERTCSEMEASLKLAWWGKCCSTDLGKKRNEISHIQRYKPSQWNRQHVYQHTSLSES